MAICEIHLTSPNALKKMTSVNVIFPEGKKGPFPVLYLLHGLSDDHTAWARRTSIERYVNDLPLIVVMPDVDRSWYTDSVTCPTARYETYITDELVSFVDGMFNTVADRRGRAVCGQSMGGYGALKLALKHPDLFCAAVSFSGLVAFSEEWKGSEISSEMELFFGPTLSGGQEDPVRLVQEADRSNLPAIYLDCGTEVFFIEDNRRMDALLDSLGIPHEYHEDSGGHSWDYWDRRIIPALAFLAKELGIG